MTHNQKLSFQDWLKKKSLVENIVTLCPVCHRQIHYAEDYQRKEMIHSLHASFSAQLQTIGIEVSKKELLSLYDRTEKN